MRRYGKAQGISCVTAHASPESPPPPGSVRLPRTLASEGHYRSCRGRNAAVPEVRGVFWSWMKSRLTAGVIVCLRKTLSGALPGLFFILCQARRALYRPHLNINQQVFAEPNRRTNRLFLANMSNVLSGVHI